MSKFFHIVNRDLINLSQEDLAEEYSDGDDVYMTESGCALLHHLDFSTIKVLIEDID